MPDRLPYEAPKITELKLADLASELRDGIDSCINILSDPHPSRVAIVKASLVSLKHDADVLSVAIGLWMRSRGK